MYISSEKNKNNIHGKSTRNIHIRGPAITTQPKTFVNCTVICKYLIFCVDQRQASFNITKAYKGLCIFRIITRRHLLLKDLRNFFSRDKVTLQTK